MLHGEKWKLLPYALKKNLHSYTRPTMLYGSECWTVKVEQTHKMSGTVEDAKMDIWL